MIDSLQKIEFMKSMVQANKRCKTKFKSLDFVLVSVEYHVNKI